MESASPLQNWSTLVQPGDIVRMAWFHPTSPSDVSGHSTTVLGAVNASGTITVYDNDDRSPGHSVIGIHIASYWNGTDPVSITIYRLDPNHQYLILGNQPSRGASRERVQQFDFSQEAELTSSQRVPVITRVQDTPPI